MPLLNCNDNIYETRDVSCRVLFADIPDNTSVQAACVLSLFFMQQTRVLAVAGIIIERTGKNSAIFQQIKKRFLSACLMQSLFNAMRLYDPLMEQDVFSETSIQQCLSFGYTGDITFRILYLKHDLIHTWILGSR